MPHHSSWHPNWHRTGAGPLSPTRETKGISVAIARIIFRALESGHDVAEGGIGIGRHRVDLAPRDLPYLSTFNPALATSCEIEDGVNLPPPQESAQPQLAV